MTEILKYGIFCASNIKNIVHYYSHKQVTSTNIIVTLQWEFGKPALVSAVVVSLGNNEE